jgi:predicted RNase H-like HicB family nuclease
MGQRRVPMTFTIEIEQEDDDRWIAEGLELPGALPYGHTLEEAETKVQALVLCIVADGLDHAEATPDLLSIAFAAA